MEMATEWRVSVSCFCLPVDLLISDRFIFKNGEKSEVNTDPELVAVDGGWECSRAIAKFSTT
jgi:hypothetical protein